MVYNFSVEALECYAVGISRILVHNSSTPPAVPAAQTAPVNALPWTSWQNATKVTVGGREYAQIGGRLYTQHAVERMLPRSLGTPAGATGPGRSIAPAFVEDVIQNGTQTAGQIVDGVQRTIHTSGTVQVITEDGGRIVITVITH